MQRAKQGNSFLLGAYSALNRQINRGKVKMFSRHEMLDLVVDKGRSKGDYN